MEHTLVPEDPASVAERENTFTNVEGCDILFIQAKGCLGKIHVLCLNKVVIKDV